jgi:hypothetical protein
MNGKLLGSAALTSCAGFTVAAVLAACGQAADPGSTESSSSSTDALNTVIGCQTDAFSCEADAGRTGFASCQQGLQACLMSLFPGGGTPPTFPSFDAGFPTRPPPPSFDAGFPQPPPRFDAGLPRPPQFDGGRPTPPPVTLPDGGAPSQQGCLADLEKCLFSGTTPTTCATDARTCLTAAAQARCDAQQKACVAAGLPTTVCDAQRMGCR